MIMNNNKNIDYEYSDIDDATLEELAALILGIGKYRKGAVQPIYVAPKVKEIIEEEEIQPIIIKKVASAIPASKKKSETKVKDDEYAFTGDGEYQFNGRQEFKQEIEDDKYAFNGKQESKTELEVNVALPSKPVEESKEGFDLYTQHRYKFVKRKIIKNEKPVQKKPVKEYKWIPQNAELFLREEKIGHKLKLTLNDNPTDDIGETVLTRNVIDMMSFDEINKPALINKPESAQKPALKPAAPKTAPAKKSQTSAAKKPVTQKPVAKKTPAKTAQKETTAPVNAKQQAKADVDAIVKKAQKKK